MSMTPREKAALDNWITKGPPEPPAWWEKWIEKIENDEVCIAEHEETKETCGGKLEYSGDGDGEGDHFACKKCKALNYHGHPSPERDED